MRLFIGCSSSNDIPHKYIIDCEKYLGELLVNNDIVFGACPSGLMGVSYRITKNHNNKVTGICPEAYKDDLLELDCDEEALTVSISDRTNKVFELSDALIFLPGGIGTVYELLTAIESKRGNEFDKPIVVYNSLGYYRRFLGFLEKMYQEQFTNEKVKDVYHISNSSYDTLKYIDEYYPKVRIK